MAYKEINTIVDDTEINRLLCTTFAFNTPRSYIEIGEDRFVLPSCYENYVKRIREFRVRDEDIFLAGHPRTGTTWAQEMVWLIINNLDFEGASKCIEHRFPYFEAEAVLDNHEVLRKTHGYSLHDFEKLKDSRCLKTHLHWYLLPKDITSSTKAPKIIYILRNPKDVCVSYYHLYSTVIRYYKGTFSEFCELFLAGRTPGGPFWKNVLSFWNRRHEFNILFIGYKEMIEDLPAVIKKVTAYLDKNITDSQIQCLAKHLSFENMKVNPGVNRIRTMNSAESMYIRVGKQGSYKSVMSQELIDRFDQWTKQNLYETGLNGEWALQ